MGADIITCKKTGVINSSCISFQYASARPLALYMLAHWHCLLAQQKGIKPSLMLLVTPVIFLPWERGIVPISNYSILLQTQLDSFWNENLTTNTQTVGQEATCQIIDGTHIHSFVLFGSSNLLLEVFTSRKNIYISSERRWDEAFLFPLTCTFGWRIQEKLRQSASACKMVFAGVLVAQEPNSSDSSPLRRGDARHRSGICQWEWKLPSAGHLTSIFYLQTPPCLAGCLSDG